MLPYFLEKAKARSESETIVKLEGIDVVETARKLTPSKVWLTEADFKKHADGSSALSLLGFTLYDNERRIGNIYEVVEQAGQFICAIEYQGHEVLVPVHDHNLRGIDRNKSTITVDLPDGLLDVYL